LPLGKKNEIIERLDQIEEKLDSLSQTDWTSLFLGSTITIVIALAVSHDQGIAIWEATKSFLNKIFSKDVTKLVL
jgi:hypothetical protein